MTTNSCDTCNSLAEGGVTTSEQEVCPPEAGDLQVVAPSGATVSNEEIRRCRECGTLYHYRYHYEYDASLGSWDEYYLWKFSEVAQNQISAIFAATQHERDSLLLNALQRDEAEIREAAALLQWAFVNQNDPIGKEVIIVSCQNLNDPATREFSYRTLLSYLRRGSDEAAAVRRILEQVPMSDNAVSYKRTLLRFIIQVNSI